ncbi:MAG: Bax inhibitor-1/YccA family protein [Pseudomonadota bacterium]|nr:Bax inhibitor-1/YccA family protein [Gammaproteobacteria bacterium]MBU1629225.1 Bax inhibitor-1/YccA family protein [Gammaproteobacteria bacterium]MBU1926903.1 Bax inhibitor-1/YccA family protein [Gammaproteobacteria bacterium]MBU2545912.1 Bax inhibitor-1/YccA family protein [Gammaproteobacteria bacterium]
MSYQDQLTFQSESALSMNPVLRKTYLLLATTLLFSALVAGWAMFSNAAPMNPFLMLVGYFALLFLTNATRHSAWGLVSVFALTGFLGYTLGPVLNLYIHAFSNGTQIVTTSLGATGVIFVALSAYTLVTKKDFSYLAGFIFIGITLAFIGGLIGLFLNIPALDLLVSMAFALISSGYILFETSLIVRGGETNYIMATVTLYVAIFNLFLSLLRILSFFSGGRR